MDQTKPTVTGSTHLETRDPKDLRPLAAVKDIDAWADDDPRFLEFCEDIKAKGIITELLVTPDNEIIDGRHRWRAANRWQMTSVPVRVVAGKELSDLILLQLSTLAHRRHYTSGQRAFIMYPLLERAHKSILLAREKSLKTGRVTTVSASGGNGPQKGLSTTADLAQTMKVSNDTFERAAKLYKYFGDNTQKFEWVDSKLDEAGLKRKTKYTLREFFEPQILREKNPMGLGFAISGIASRLEQERKGRHGGGPPTEVLRQVELFGEVFDDLTVRTRQYWDKFKDEDKTAVRAHIKQNFSKTPEDLLKIIGSEVRAELQRRESSHAS